MNLQLLEPPCEFTRVTTVKDDDDESYKKEERYRSESLLEMFWPKFPAFYHIVVHSRIFISLYELKLRITPQPPSNCCGNCVKEGYCTVHVLDEIKIHITLFRNTFYFSNGCHRKQSFVLQTSSRFASNFILHSQ